MPHEIVRLKSGRTLPTPDSSDGLSSVKLLIIIAGVLMGGFILALLVVNVLTERAMGRPGEATAKFLPADTQVYFTINLRPGASQIRKARKVISIFEGTSGFGEQREDLVEDLDDETGIDLTEDVYPWIGKDITFAFMDAPAGSDYWWVVLLQTNDREASREFLNELGSYLEDTQLHRFEQLSYRHGNIIYTEETEKAAFGLTDEYVLIGSNSTVVKATIRDLESPPSPPCQRTRLSSSSANVSLPTDSC